MNFCQEHLKFEGEESMDRVFNCLQNLDIPTWKYGRQYCDYKFDKILKQYEHFDCLRLN